MHPVPDGSHGVPRLPTHPQTLVQEGQSWMELRMSNVPSITPLTFGFMREDQAWLAMVVFTCLLTPPHTYAHKHKAWMAAGAAQSHSHLDAMS